MKCSLPLAAALFLFSTVNAQQWCAPGAEWLFGFGSQAAVGVRHAWYAGDTIVGGLAAKRIDQDIHAYIPVFPFTTPFYATAPSLFTAEVDDRVMLWSTSTNTYDTLMWFGAVPGDHWEVPHLAFPARFDVLDTGTAVVDGIPLRYLVLEEPIVMGFTDTLRERIGFSYYYIDPAETFFIDFTTDRLQCYHDNDIVEFDGSMASYPCDFSLAVDQVSSTSDPLAPNPGNDHFMLDLPPGVHTISVFDELGRPVLRQRTSEARAWMDTGDLPAGIYMVRIDEFGAVHRWVKQ